MNTLHKYVAIAGCGGLILSLLVFCISLSFADRSESITEVNDVDQPVYLGNISGISKPVSCLLWCKTEGRKFRINISDIVTMNKDELIQAGALIGFVDALQWSFADPNEKARVQDYIVDKLVPIRFRANLKVAGKGNL